MEQWKFYNPFTITGKASEIFENVTDTENSPNLPKISPKINGDWRKEYVTIPFCKFDNSPYNTCNLFIQSKNTLHKQICHTFNADGKAKAKSIGSENGLVFVFNHRMPKNVEKSAEIVIHEPGSDVDLDDIRNVRVPIVSNKHITIGIKPTINDYTKQFVDISPKQR